MRKESTHMAKADQTSGSDLAASGDRATYCAAGNTAVSTSKGRVCRVLLSSGTGAITIYDALSATGNPIFAGTGTAIAAAGGAVELDCPVTTGIYVVVAATTAFTVVYA
jgi:DNA-binding phage protein